MNKILYFPIESKSLFFRNPSLNSNEENKNFKLHNQLLDVIMPD